MTVAVAGDNDRGYVSGNVPLDFVGGNSAALSMPGGAGQKQIAVISVDSGGTINITYGTATTGTPSPPTYPFDEMVVAEIYLRQGGTVIKDTDDSTNGYIYKDRSPLLSLGATPTLVGSITAYGAGTTPDGYLVCDGSEVSRTTYADLFAVIGTRFGIGDGSSTFNLPDSQVLNSLDLVPYGDGSTIGDMTSGGGLAAAFNDDIDEVTSSCAWNPPAADSFVGKDWGAGVTKFINGVQTWGSSNAGYSDGGQDETIELWGSNSSPSNATDGTLLGTIVTALASVANANPQEKFGGFTMTTAYRYHWVRFDIDGTDESYCAEIRFWESPAIVLIKT